MWIGFADRIEALLTPDGDLRDVTGLANKLPQHAARIAGVLTLACDIDAAEVGESDMAAGIGIAQYYAREALRLQGGARTPEDLRLAQKALDWLACGWKEPAISLPDLYQKGPLEIRNAKTAKSVAATLQDHAWLVPIPQGAVVAGSQRREAWRIVRGDA
jgi:hypothetical protein